MNVPNPKGVGTAGFLNYKKPFNVFNGSKGTLQYIEAFNDASEFIDAKYPLEYIYNPQTGRISWRKMYSGQQSLTIETSVEKNGVDSAAAARGKILPVGKPNDPAHAWSVISAHYAKRKSK